MRGYHSANFQTVANVEAFIHLDAGNTMQAPASSQTKAHPHYQTNTDNKLPISLHYYQVNTYTSIACEEYYSISNFKGFSIRQALSLGGTDKVVCLGRPVNGTAVSDETT